MFQKTFAKISIQTVNNWMFTQNNDDRNNNRLNNNRLNDNRLNNNRLNIIFLTPHYPYKKRKIRAPLAAEASAHDAPAIAPTHNIIFEIIKRAERRIFHGRVVRVAVIATDNPGWQFWKNAPAEAAIFQKRRSSANPSAGRLSLDAPSKKWGKIISDRLVCVCVFFFVLCCLRICEFLKFGLVRVGWCLWWVWEVCFDYCLKDNIIVIDK